MRELGVRDEEREKVGWGGVIGSLHDTGRALIKNRR